MRSETAGGGAPWTRCGSGQPCPSANTEPRLSAAIALLQAAGGGGPAVVSVSRTAPCAARGAPPGGTHPPPATAVIGEPPSPAEPQGVKGRDEKTGRRIVWVEVSGGRWTEWEEEVSLD